MPEISLKEIQFAIDDSIGINTFDNKEETNDYDIHFLLSGKRGISCSESY